MGRLSELDAVERAVVEPRAAAEQKCDAWAAAGEHLRASVGWRHFQGKTPVMAAVTGVRRETIEQFVETGEINDVDRMMLEAFK